MITQSFYLSTRPDLQPKNLRCLKGQDVITAQISDHHPVISPNALFWNIMMQGKARKRESRTLGYNNGFGIVESDQQYIQRLLYVARVTAEIIYNHPSIETIGYCEGPVHADHLKFFLNELKKYPWMKRFLVAKSCPLQADAANWGLLMLADASYSVADLTTNFFKQIGKHESLANRFKLWELKKEGVKKHFSLAHFPFGGDSLITEKEKLSEYGKLYCSSVEKLLEIYNHEQLVVCADFNLNPYLISRPSDRIHDQVPINNSILSLNEKTAATVDGILLSLQEKRKLFGTLPDNKLFNSMLREYSLFKAGVRKYLENNRHHDYQHQREYDKNFGLIAITGLKN